jgi:ribosome recycling factor
MESIIEETKKRMEKTILAFSNGIATIRAGAPSPALVDRVKFKYHGFDTEIRQVAYIQIQGNNIIIKPFEKGDIKAISEAVSNAQSYLQIKSESDHIKVIVPPLSTERRKELVKELSKKGEEGKVALRNIRRQLLDDIKKDKQTGEDQRKRWEKQLQETTDDYIKKIDGILKTREKEILTI